MNRVMRYAIDHASPGEARADLLRSLRESFPGLPPERFDWIYRRNPAGEAYVWTARVAEQDTVVGSTAVFPRRVAVGSAYHTAGIAGDYAVSPSHRGFGPALALQQRAVATVKEGRLDLVYGLPNPLSAPLLRRAGYRSIGDVVQLTRVLRSRRVLERHVPSRLLARMVAPVVDVGLRVMAGAQRRTGHPRHAFESADIPTFDRRFDRLWQMARPRHPMIGDRSAAFLRWRFSESPHARYRIFGLLEAPRGELAGYVVYHRVERRTFIDDLLCRDLGDTLDTLIRRFALHQLDDGASAISISFFGRAALIEALRRQRFAVRAAQDPVMIYVADGSPLAEVARSPENWWLLPADNDI